MMRAYLKCLQTADDLDGIALLRALLDELPNSRVGRAAAKCINFYIEHAATENVFLGEAFGLNGKPWWKTEAYQRRNDALRECAAFVALDSSVIEQSRVLSRELRLYRETRWKHDSFLVNLPEAYKHTKYEFLWRAYDEHRRSGDNIFNFPVGISRLQQIISGRE